MKNKKASFQIGLGIIAIGLLFLIVGIATDNYEDDSKQKYQDKKDQYSDETNYYESYLFALFDTDLGKQQIQVESFPNIQLGSKVVYNTVHIANPYRLIANPFTNSQYSFDVYFTEEVNLNEYLIYAKIDRISGDNPINVYANGDLVAKISGKATDFPLLIKKKPVNSSTVLTFEVEKPAWYSLFNWNKVDVTDLRVVEVTQDKKEGDKEFNFQVDFDFLERMYIDLVISCDTVTESAPAIKTTINGYIVGNQNPRCTSSQNTITVNVPLNILNEEKNTLKLETSGYYNMAYRLNKVYFNDQDVYKFNINSFNDIIDVVMYGDFDRDAIDFRLNSHTFSLTRNEIKSIIPYLRFGVNELRILTKPVEIEELVIEKNEFLEFKD